MEGRLLLLFASHEEITQAHGCYQFGSVTPTYHLPSDWERSRCLVKVGVDQVIHSSSKVSMVKGASTKMSY